MKTIERRFAPFTFEAGDILTLESPGGGGYGPSEEREMASVDRDVEAGLMDPAHAVQPIGALGAVARARPTCRTGAGLHIRASRLILLNRGLRARRAARRLSAATRWSCWISLASTRPSRGYMPSMSSNSSVVTVVMSMPVTTV